MTVPNVRPVTDALVAFLAAQTGQPVGRATAPIQADGTPYDPAQDPYAIVWPIPGGTSWGPGLVAPDAGAQLHYQVTSVGARSDQADWMADKVRQAMVGRTAGGQLAATLTVPGVAVLDRELSLYGGVDREGDVVSVPDSYIVHVTL